MSLPGEASKVASSTIEALKSSPALLVLVLLQISTMVAIYVIAQAQQGRAHEREMALIKECFAPKIPTPYAPGHRVDYPYTDSLVRSSVTVGP